MAMKHYRLQADTGTVTDLNRNKQTWHPLGRIIYWQDALAYKHVELVNNLEYYKPLPSHVNVKNRLKLTIGFDGMPIYQ
jgi:hypothetical protein